MVQELWSAYQAYRPAKIIDRPIMVFRSSAQVYMPRHHRNDLGWSSLTSASCSVHLVEGNHVSMMHDPYVERIAHFVNAGIDRHERN